MNPLIADGKKRMMFLAAVLVLLLLAVLLVPLKLVRVKMLPFDNKSEFQVIVDMPDGTTLEQTTAAAQALAAKVAQELVESLSHARLHRAQNGGRLPRIDHLEETANDHVPFTEQPVFASRDGDGHRAGA